MDSLNQPLLTPRRFDNNRFLGLSEHRFLSAGRIWQHIKRLRLCQPFFGDWINSETVEIRKLKFTIPILTYKYKFRSHFSSWFSKFELDCFIYIWEDTKIKASVISNLEFGGWNEVFGDKHLTAASLDRVIHHGQILSFSGESFRFKEAMANRKRESKEGFKLTNNGLTS